MKKDVSNEMETGMPDDEVLPITKCVCGAEFDTWAFCISVYEDDPDECRECGRKFFWVPEFKIFEIK